MMYCHLTDTGAERYTITDLRRAYPQILFPAVPSLIELATYGVYPVTLTAQPAYDQATQTVEESTPVQIDGVWTQQWNVRDLTPEELKSRIPQEVTALQGLLAIDAAGLSGAYETWANDPDRTFAQRAFIQRAQTWRRDDPTLQGAAEALGLTEAQLDDLFTLAATL